MIPTIDVEDLDMDESPSTIAYALLVCLSSLYDIGYMATTDILGNETLVLIQDQEDPAPLFALNLSPGMADLMVAILDEMSETISEGTQ